jgi:hypothetical protein
MSQSTYGFRPWPRPPPDRYSPERSGISTILELTSYRDAIVHPERRLVLTVEIATLERTSTWDLVPLPPRFCPITYKWFYKIKTRSNGSLDRYKTRLVDPCFQQEHGPHYNETFAPVAHMTTFRTLLVVGSVCHWLVSQLDVKNAFT